MPQLLMPKMGDAMEEGTILRWLKNEGEAVAEQEEIAEIQTEKASITIPATEAGVLLKILVAAGATVPVGAPIAEMSGSADESRVTLRTDRSAGGTPRPSSDGPRVKASPLARKMAEEHGVDIRAIEGTGPGGRIIEADVEDALRRQVPVPAVPSGITDGHGRTPTGAGGRVRAMSPIRKVIAKRLTQSKQTVPHFYLTTDVDMRAAVRLRADYNTAVGEERKISLNDLVVRACALALQQHPALNSQLDGDSIRTADSSHVGVAVSLEEGLIVPVIRDAQTKSLSAIAREVRQLADRARKGQLRPEEYSGGTFTISNLGMYDITQFQAIVNPPEAAILAVGTVRETPIVENGQVVPGKQMHLTISVDHRIVDGSAAAAFLAEVKRLLRNPLSLFS